MGISQALILDDMVTFQIVSSSMDIFWVLYFGMVVVKYFWGGDYRTNREIIVTDVF